MSKPFLIVAFLCFLILVHCASAVFAQKNIPILERKITVSLANMKVDAALNSIAAAGGFTFSYNPSQIDISRTVNYQFNAKTVREIINVLFNGRIEGKARGSHLILSHVKVTESKKDNKERTFIIAGYVESRKGEKIQWASVYNKESLSSAITDAYGYYVIELSADLKDLTLNVSKQNYNDTVVQLNDNRSDFIIITLDQPVSDTIPAFDMDKLYADAERTASSFFMTEEDKANSLNITDTIYRKWQVSVIPFIGTNGRLSGNVINDYSFNIFGGYSMGTKKMELAGLFNVNRSDVSYAQLAGISNASGGNVDGAQIAGFTNTIKGGVKGVQLAGFVNAAWKESNAVQIAGFSNTLRAKSKAVQISGFTNTMLDTSSGVQISGFCNVALREFKGTQVSGFLNYAKQLTGNQTGFCNYAKNVNGAQVGFFNYSDTCTGVPVGFLSFVYKGYHKLEISGDEVFYLNAAFRTGVREFHNILTAGMQPFDSGKLLWTFGYGVGSTIKTGRKTAIDVDLISSQVMSGDLEKLNLINKFYLGFEWQFAKKTSLAFGPTLNMHIYKTDYPDYPLLFDKAPEYIYSETFPLDNLAIDMWIGGKIGIRFL